MKFEVAQNTLVKPNKTKNGDFCSFDFLENEQILIAVLCDGVGSNACDWKASKVGCEKFISDFKIEVKENITTRISSAIKKVNQELLLEIGSCEFMKSTFTTIVWELEKNQYHYVSIGDSRIYEYKNDQVTQISKDETKSVILKKKDGKPMIISGVAVVTEGITNAIGSGSLQFQIFTKDITLTKGLILATDGFFNVSNQFPNHMIDVLNSINFQSALDQLQSKYKENQKDDMTILAIRKIESNKNDDDILKAILTNKPLSDWSDLVISKAALQGIEDGIKNLNVDQVSHLLQFSEKRNFDFGRKSMTDLISLMAKMNFQERDIYQKILNMMRQFKND